MRLAVLLVVASPLLAADPKPGDEGTPDFAAATELVKQLGHRQFAVREAAAKQLVEMGHAAVPALQKGTRADDEEVRSRCTAPLPQAKAAGWKHRAVVYLAKPDEKHDLPLLADWDKLIGKPDAATRKLFAEIVRTNGDLLEHAAAEPRRASAICEARSAVILERVRGPKGQLKAEIGDLAAVLFIDAVFPGPLSLSETLPAYLLSNPSLPEMLDALEAGPAVRRLLVRWVEVWPTNNPTPKVLFADLARRKPFPEAVPALVKLAKDTSRQSYLHRLLAIEALGATGGKDAAAGLAETVPDSTAWMRSGSPDGPEGPSFGDQALAASLILHGKKPEDFGMVANKYHFVPHIGRTNIPITVYNFRDTDARAKAVGRWKELTTEKGHAKK
jgi:hypothetical protein